jgi:uncharacterized membrane protein
MTKPSFAESAHRWFGRHAEELSPAEALVLSATRARNVISHDIQQAFAEKLTFGQRLADRVAIFGGSWGFILSFCGFLLAWVAVNTLLLASPFDAYPFIFLNLLLSMTAAIQAPVIFS